MKITQKAILLSVTLTPVLVLASPPVATAAQDQTDTSAQTQVSPEKAEGKKKTSAQDTKNTTPGALVEVTGTRDADEVYRVEAVSSPGPLGMGKLLNVPHTMAILPATLIENVQATSVKEALKYLPLAQFQEQQGSEVLRPATRGMQGSNYQNTRMDGMTIFVTGANALEPLQQIEVFSGLPASVYGPANPAGMFNFVTKRPTNEPLLRLNLGYDSSNILTAHADLGGKIAGSEVFSYRLNLLDSHGTSFVTYSELDRKLASLAFDVRPSREMTIEFNLSSYDLKQQGYPGWFTYGGKITLPDAPDPTKVGFGQAYAGVDLNNKTESARLIQNLGSNWVLVVGALAQQVQRNINTPVNNLTDNAGDYTSSLANGFAPHFGITSDIAYLNGTFKTGDIRHDLTLGTTGFKATTYGVLNTPTPASVLLGSASIATPRVFAEPLAGLPDVANQYVSSVAKQQGINLGDTMAFSSQWSVKLALSQDWMETENFNKAGAMTTSFNKNGLSPMPSVIYKLLENVTTYLTYASSLQQGDIAPAGSKNANTALAPYRSKQWEAGVKVTTPRLDYSIALFRLERPFAYVDATDNTFKIQGRQVNPGLEATLIGKVTNDLRIYSGITLLDPRLEATGNPLTNDNQYVGMPKVRSNLLFEYWVPEAPGFVVTLDWQYVGKRPGNDTNTTWTPSYEVLDLGARYTTRLLGKAATWRLVVNNLTDKHYWSTIGPSNITGANTGNMTAHLGAPRTVAASMSINF